MTNEEFIESIRLDGEIWKDVVGYEGFYMVSSLGRIMSCERFVVCGRGGRNRLRPKLMALFPIFSKKIKYQQIGLNKNGEHKTMRVHRIVASAFIPNPNCYSEIDHINRDGSDNRVENLRWCTHSMNMLNEETRKIVSSSKRGKPIEGLWKPVVMIKNGVEVRRYNGIALAEKDGFSSAGITKVCRGERRKYAGYSWMYAYIFDEREKNKKKYLSI